ncbi:hypothetical protein LTR70_005702 [Exophiala xenobiotica]|nr:hypothetical protein LTR70_005702 [Exophiala xenobiotica]
MLLTESVQPFQFTANPSGSMHQPRHTQDNSAVNWRSHARSVSSISSASSGGGLRLADIARQHGMGIHVENWREDMFPVRQYLPMQHIIGSLKRDRDEQVCFRVDEDVSAPRKNLIGRQSELASTSPRGEGSFVQTARTPKRRRTSDSSHTGSQSTLCTSDSDPDRRFSYQSVEHMAKEIPQSALPGLSHILNLATITADERDIFSEFAPKHLDDPQLLMNEVLQLRERMMDEGEKDEKYEEDVWDGSASTVGVGSPIIPPERDAEVRKAFENFVDLDGSDSILAKT